jgi:hypothetical protein
MGVIRLVLSRLPIALLALTLEPAHSVVRFRSPSMVTSAAECWPSAAARDQHAVRNNKLA